MFRRFTRAALVALPSVFALSLGAALADPAPTPTPAPATQAEIGRVSTSDRHDEPIDRTTRTTFVVDRAQIEARSDRTIADALVNVPGVDIYRQGGFGSLATVFIRGASTTSVLVLLDGVPVSPGSNEDIDLGSFSTNGVSRIEIVEGSGSTLYGSSAVGGVINIITTIPRGTYLELAAGSFQDRDVRVGAGDGTLGVSFERHTAQNNFNYPELPQPDGTPVPAGRRFNSDAEQTSARLAYNGTIGSISVRVRLGSDAMHLGIPGALTGFGPDATARENTSRDDAHVDFTYAAAQSATTLTVAGSRQNLDYLDPAFGTENPTLDGRAQVSLLHTISAGPSTFVAGIDLARESAVLANIETFDANFNPSGVVSPGIAQSESALYAQEQYQFAGGFRVSAGLRGENETPFGSALTPHLGIGIPLASRLQLVANAGTAYRVPTIVDRYYPGFSNPNLVPERSKDFDIAFQSSALLGGASLGYFQRDSANLIQDDANFVPQNIAQATVHGLIGTIRTRSYAGYTGSLSVTDTYRAQDLSAGAFAARLPFTPVFAGKLAIEKAFVQQRLAFGVLGNIYGSHLEGGAVNPGVTTVDAYVRGRVARDAVLSLHVNDIGNVFYQPVLGYPSLGRTYEVELSTR